jgi:hypothetical protein
MPQEHRTIPLAKDGSTRASCPLTPPEHAGVPAKSLHRACLIMGGIEQLENRLQVPRDALERWMRGDGEPPQAVFYAALEIILLYVAKASPA